MQIRTHLSVMAIYLGIFHPRRHDTLSKREKPHKHLIKLKKKFNQP